MSSSSVNSSTLYPPSSYPELSLPQMRALEIVERTMSVISITGCLFIISSFILFRSLKRKMFNRLLFLASWGNLMANVATIIGPAGVEAGANSAICKAQATLIQWYVQPLLFQVAVIYDLL
jgi:hypothetical protein